LSESPFHLFDVTGVELEYMVVDRETLSVAPIVDQLLTTADSLARNVPASEGNPEGDPEFGPIAWSNELARHVVEFKTAQPVRSLAPVAGLFQENVKRANDLLAPLNACLLPAAMHPWMDPMKEMQLWPHGYKDVYQAFDRIFSCKGHGWANLQSMHINLPFSGDEEFGRLHAAIRLVLPILPAIAASSPIVEGRTTGLLDNRLEVYRNNSRRVPSVAGKVIPEPVYTEREYTEQILEKIWKDLSAHDPEGVLRHEWANARGCIARFTRGSIEIRVIDVQECPAADLAICRAVVALVKSLANGPLAASGDTAAAMRAAPVDALHEIFLACVRDADKAVISNMDYLRWLGVSSSKPLTAGEVWRAVSETLPEDARCSELETILRHGCLSRRILRAINPAAAEKPVSAEVSRDAMKAVYQRLATCLAQGRMF